MFDSSEKLELIASGRRGVFDGTVENMHLHWKYRELIKILVKAKSLEGAKKVAMALEAESGGILVSVDKISKGYAVIVYRGKDYKRPTTLRPKNLLTKRKALARSLELQKREVRDKKNMQQRLLISNSANLSLISTFYDQHLSLSSYKPQRITLILLSYLDTLHSTGSY